jgi:hypothetical protein
MALETTNTEKALIVRSGSYRCQGNALCFTRLFVLGGDVYGEDPSRLRPC